MPLALLDPYFLLDETYALEKLIDFLDLPEETVTKIQQTTEKLVINTRKSRLQKGGLDAFLSQYHLSSQEGIVLMCIAEALLRIPDKLTIDKLIQDKLCQANWDKYAGKSESLFVNAATFGLMLTGKIISVADTQGLEKTFKKLIQKSSQPLIRKAIAHAMKILGKQFVMGETMRQALENSRNLVSQGYTFSYDMLGEAACTQKDADKYFNAYQNAIDALSHNPSAGISIKLSALHPRYEFAQSAKVIPLLSEKLLQLALQAKKANIGLTVDAEESERLALSLEIITRVFKHPDINTEDHCAGCAGFGLAVQSYQKRAFYLIDDLATLAKSEHKKIMIRLIKGAYWDTEIKNAQVKGLSNYPVFTRKTATDISFLACAKKIIQYGQLFYPAFATHNAHSLASVLEMMGERRDFEFQCLHGMGYTLYDQIVGKNNPNIACRVYAPVGTHEDLLAYLVRRLLENGANSSFVNRIIDSNIPVSALTEYPVAKINQCIINNKLHSPISLPENIYGHTRKNAMTINLNSQTDLEKLNNSLKDLGNISQKLDKTINHTDIEQTLMRSQQAFSDWEETPVEKRALCLDKVAELLEQNLAECMSILIYEAKKTLPDALAEIREAVDFCRYYAEQARKQLALPTTLPGPTGESNQLFLRGRGSILCISPWNFPLAIFLGQITAALVSGNTVIAKPATQTPDIANFAINILYQAGIPRDAVQLLLTSGKRIGEQVVSDTRIKGVIFTGSTETARNIHQTLANRTDQIVPLIAETGGQNAMIVDSSALPEQVIQAVIQSAFMSAGQRCSALRVLFLQEDIADKIIQMLQGAVEQLVIGDPSLIQTDIGPVIDHQAYLALHTHFEHMKKTATLLCQASIHPDIAKTIPNLFAPCAFEIDHISRLTHEVFGPILHIIRFASHEIDKVVDSINQSGYGLTLGIHSRIDKTAEYIQKKANVGNIYINRNMIGAVVGVQPFGGEGLSGTGPKAGGPHYLFRLCVERTVTVNTTAAGGNASLLALSE